MIHLHAYATAKIKYNSDNWVGTSAE